MRIIFAGTPEFAATSLSALLERGHEIAAVLTQPDRPSGRGMKLTPSPVKQLAQRHDLPVLQPRTLKDADIQLQLDEMRADVMIVAAYGLILPAAVLRLPRLGCLNIHASLLPRWRGAAPIQRAILAGDRETGITIMQMDEGLDTGAMLLRKTCPIDARDTGQSLHDKLAILGAAAIVEALQLLASGSLKGESQQDAQATYAAKLEKSEANIDWRIEAEQIGRMVRAYNPFPVARTHFDDLMIRIWQASVLTGRQGKPGEVLSMDSDGIVVACGQDALRLEVLQRPGARAMDAVHFLQGVSIHAGSRFNLPE